MQDYHIFLFDELCWLWDLVLFSWNTDILENYKVARNSAVLLPKNEKFQFKVVSVILWRFSSIYLAYLQELNHEVLLSVHHQLQMNVRMKNVKFRGFISLEYWHLGKLQTC